MMGLGHSLLAMSGFETLAQVNRQIAHPKQKNLEQVGRVIFIYSLTFTSLVSFFTVTPARFRRVRCGRPCRWRSFRTTTQGRTIDFAIATRSGLPSSALEPTFMESIGLQSSQRSVIASA